MSASTQMTGFAISAADGDILAGNDIFRAVLRPDQAGNAELPGNDRRMTGPAAPVGDDTAGLFHHRFPVRVGHVGNQHFARLEVMNTGDGLDNPGRALADFSANGLAGGKYGAVLF